MKRSLSSLILCPLLVIVLIVSGCDTVQGQDTGQGQDTITNAAIQCLSAITVEVAAVVVGDPVGIPDVIGVVTTCVSAAVAAFSAPSNTNPSSPEVTIHPSPTDNVTTLTVNSNLASNCTTHTKSIQFHVSVSFVLYVGDTPNQSKYSSSPTGSSDNDLIAQQIFKQYETDISKSIPPLTIQQDVPPNTQMQLHVPIQLSYKNGAAQVVNNGTTTDLPWLFTDGYTQAGAVTFTGSTASNCSQ